MMRIIESTGPMRDEDLSRLRVEALQHLATERAPSQSLPEPVVKYLIELEQRYLDRVDTDNRRFLRESWEQFL